MNELELTGRAYTHVIDVSDAIDASDLSPCTLHKAAAGSWVAMRAAAKEAGIDLTPASAFRDFAAQLRIWNDKFQGRRPLYDRDGRPLERTALSEPQIVDAILWWSALPGASRHHWGSEIDVFDRAALQPGRSARLLPEEYAADGPFARLTEWLDRNMSHYGFFRPYRTDRGGVSPEPWHLSYAPVATAAIAQLSETVLRRTVAASGIEGKAIVLERLSEIHRRYVANVDGP